MDRSHERRLKDSQAPREPGGRGGHKSKWQQLRKASSKSGRAGVRDNAGEWPSLLHTWHFPAGDQVFLDSVIFATLGTIRHVILASLPSLVFLHQPPSLIRTYSLKQPGNDPVPASGRCSISLHTEYVHTHTHPCHPASAFTRDSRQGGLHSLTLACGLSASCPQLMTDSMYPLGFLPRPAVQLVN